MLTTESGCEQAGIAFSSKPREKDVELTSDRHKRLGSVTAMQASHIRDQEL